MRRKEYVLVGPKKRKVEKNLHDTLLKYYDLDDEKGIATILFQFDRFSDFFETDIGKRPLLKGRLKEELEALFLRLPECYDLDLEIRIENGEGHPEKEAFDALKDGLFFNAVDYRKRMTGKTISAFVLLVIGILLLLTMALLEVYLFQGESSLLENVVVEVLDIAAWVFVWEAVTIYFIERKESRIAWDRSRERIKDIRLHIEKNNSKEPE